MNKKKFAETFHVVFKTMKLPIFLTEREREKKSLTKCKEKGGERLAGVGAKGINSWGSNKIEEEFSLLLCPRMC